MQKPLGPKDVYCPFWRKPMSAVCHTCPLWIEIQGTDPNTGHKISDGWRCAFTWMPILLVENAQQSRQSGAAIESFRNAMVAQNQVLTTVHGPDLTQIGHEP